MRPEFISLSEILSAGRAANFPVTEDRSGLVPWSVFVRDVGSLYNRLEANSPKRYGLICQSSYAFVVGLMALWQRGHLAVLPANSQLGNIQEIVPETQGILSDKSLLKNCIPILSKGLDQPFKDWKVLPESQPVLELWTSGSAGERKRVPKQLGQLSSELAVLEKTFGLGLGSARIFSTVSHQHIYGLLFRVLWPLCAGRIFFSETPLLWEDLLPLLKCGGDRGGCALVSSPAHLQRLKGMAPKDFKEAGCRVIFSSGGPLTRDSARLVKAISGFFPIEVFGSTETGGLGWRTQDGESEQQEWQTLEGVRISALEGQRNLLRVSSPFLSTPSLLLDDRGHVEPNGNFRILGREDRIVKIAEKRISLDEMERRLVRHDWIEKAFVVVWLDDISHRQKMGTLAVLSEIGNEVLARQGHQEMTQTLRRYLTAFYEDSAVPKLFRYYESHFPIDAQGKTTGVLAKEIFCSSSHLPVTQPIMLREMISENKMEYFFRVPDNLIYLDGHFPSFALVPGVVQIQWVADLVSRWQRRELAIRAMESIKFKDVLLPGAEFHLTAEMSKKESGEQVLFSLKNEKSLYASGKLIY